MKNILNEKPTAKLHGRLRASVGFVDDEDIKNKTILDIGCGYGWCEMNFLERDARRVSAIEISKEDLETIKRSVKDERLDCAVGSALLIPYPDRSFDTAIAWEVIEHIPKNQELKMLSEINRVLKPQGCLYLSTPNSSFFANIFDPAWWLGHRHYKFNRLKELTEKNGLRITRVRTFGRWWTTFSIFNLYLSKWIFRKERVLKQLFDQKEDGEYSKDGFVNTFIKFKKI